MRAARRCRVTGSPRSAWRHGVTLLFSACLVATTLTACGSGPGGSSTVVRIAKPVDTIAFTALDVALDQGFFKEQGINAQVVLLGGSSVVNSALQSGSVQFASVAALPLMLARSKKIPVVSVAGINYGVSLQLIVGGNRMRQVSGSKSLAERMRVLAGAKIGHVSASDGNFIDLMVKRAGLPANSVRKVSFESASAAVTALRQGAVDAAIGSPPNTVQPVSEGEAAVVANASEIPEYQELINDVVGTTEKYAKANPKTVKAVATAIAKADNLMRSGDSSVLAFEKKHYPRYSEDVLRKSLALSSFCQNGLQTAGQWNSALAAYKDGNDLGGVTVNEGDTWTNEYIKKPEL